MQAIRYLPLYIPTFSADAIGRLCMLNFGDGTTIHTLPIPNTNIDQGDRQHLLDLACDNLVAGPPAPTDDFTTLDANRVRGHRQQYPLHDY